MASEDIIDLLTRLLNYVFAIPMLTLGMIGCGLIVLLFTQKRQFRRNTSLTYLLAGAIVTGIHLPTVYIQMIMVYGFHVSLMNTNVDACREHTYLRYVTTVAAISFPCWAAFDQYVSTSRNAAVRHRWGSKRVTNMIIVGTIIFWIVFYIPILFNTNIINGVCSLKPTLYTKFNTYAFTPIAYCFGPISVIVFSILGTIKNLRHNNLPKSRDRLAVQVRAMMMPQLLILAISGIPFGFQGVYLDITSGRHKGTYEIAMENFIGQIILIFYHFNYAFMFYIYVYKSTEVRKALKNQFFRCIGKRRLVTDDSMANPSVSLRRLNASQLDRSA